MRRRGRHSSSCLTNTTRHPSRNGSVPPLYKTISIHSRAHRVRSFYRPPAVANAAALVDGGTVINSLQDECCCCCSGIGSPPRAATGTHLGPLGGFTPFDRIELDIFALIIWHGAAAAAEFPRVYTNNNNNTHKHSLYIYCLHTEERTATTTVEEKNKNALLYSPAAKYFYR